MKIWLATAAALVLGAACSKTPEPEATTTPATTDNGAHCVTGP